jgi:hypothetical protein
MATITPPDAFYTAEAVYRAMSPSKTGISNTERTERHRAHREKTVNRKDTKETRRTRR